MIGKGSPKVEWKGRSLTLVLSKEISKRVLIHTVSINIIMQFIKVRFRRWKTIGLLSNLVHICGRRRMKFGTHCHAQSKKVRGESSFDDGRLSVSHVKKEFVVLVVSCHGGKPSHHSSEWWVQEDERNFAHFAKKGMACRLLFINL